MDSLKPHIYSETGRLRTLVLGTAKNLGPVPSLDECYDPKSKESVNLGIYPEEADLCGEMEGVAKILERYDVEVLRPSVLKDVNQIFARDISFVIEDRFIIPEIIPDRQAEMDGMRDIEARIPENQIVRFDTGERAEGGDCMPWREHIFIGYTPDEHFASYKTARSNMAAVKRLRSLFPEKKVCPIALVKNDDDPRQGILHLDCCFQPIGTQEAIFFEEGLANAEDREMIKALFGEENLIRVAREEFYRMFPNVFSINEKTIISNSSFTRLNAELRLRGYTVEETPYDEVSKMGGLLRCCTMPIHRDHH